MVCGKVFTFLMKLPTGALPFGFFCNGGLGEGLGLTGADTSGKRGLPRA